MKNRKKALVTAIAMMASMSTSYSALAFDDIEGHWAEETLAKWSEMELINGFIDNTLRPDASISRAEFVKMIVTSLGLTKTTEINFIDVNPDDWFYEYVAIASAYGIANGLPDGSFAPNEIVTRVQAGVFMSNALGIVGGNIENYTDFEDIPSWGADAVGAMTELGFFKGLPDGSFSATNLLSRAEAIVFLDRIMESEYSAIYDEELEDLEELEPEIDDQLEETDTDTSLQNSDSSSSSSSGSSSGSSSSGSSSSDSTSKSLDYTDFNSLIEQSQVIYDENANLYDKSTDLWLEFEIKLNMDLTSLSTQSEIDQETERLQEIIQNLDTIKLDFSILETLLDEISYDTFKYDLTNSFWADFHDDFKYAEALLNSQYATQEQIDYAYEELTKSYGLLDGALIDITDLLAKISDAEKIIKDNLVLSDDLGESFYQIYDNAVEISSFSTQTTQEYVDSITEKLQDLISTLYGTSISISNCELLENNDVLIGFMAKTGLDIKFIAKETEEKPEISEFSENNIISDGSEQEITITVNSNDKYVFACFNDYVTDAFEIDISEFDEFEVYSIEIEAINGTNLTKGSPLVQDEIPYYGETENEYLNGDASGTEEDETTNLDDDDYVVEGFDTNNYPDTDDTFVYKTEANVDDTLTYKVNFLNKRGNVILAENLTSYVLYWDIIDTTILESDDLSQEMVAIKALKEGSTSLIINIIDTSGIRPGVLSQFIEITIN